MPEGSNQACPETNLVRQRHLGWNSAFGHPSRRSGTQKIAFRSPAVETAGYSEPSRRCGTVAMLYQRSLSSQTRWRGPQTTGVETWQCHVSVFGDCAPCWAQDRSKSFFAPEKPIALAERRGNATSLRQDAVKPVRQRHLAGLKSRVCQPSRMCGTVAMLYQHSLPPQTLWRMRITLPRP
jgi:hypothetical protein